MMKLYFIRHGMTDGNRKKRYIGITDEPLCEEGIGVLREEARNPDIQKIRPGILLVSPMLRCLQTADILFPDIPRIVVPELAEMNFGIFENKSYQEELSQMPEYQSWLDSRCEDPIPEGEKKEDFTKRCRAGFQKALEELKEQEEAAFVVHGGTIMSILSEYAFPKKAYYEWKAENGQGFRGNWDGERITDIESLVL